MARTTTWAVTALLTLAALTACGKGGGTAPQAAPEQFPPIEHPTGSAFELPTGGEPIKVEVLQAGEGRPVKRGSTVKLHYVGKLLDGKQWKSTREKGGPVEFMAGIGKEWPGFDLTVSKMRQGDRWRSTIPSPFAFGKHGGPFVPANSTVVLEIEMLEVK